MHSSHIGCDCRCLRVGRIGFGSVWFQLEISHLHQLLELLVDQILEAVDAHRRLLLHEPHELGDEQRVLLLQLVLQRLHQRVGDEDRHVHEEAGQARDDDDPARRQGVARHLSDTLLRAEDEFLRLCEVPSEELREHHAEAPQLRDEEPVQRRPGLLPSTCESNPPAGKRYDRGDQHQSLRGTGGRRILHGEEPARTDYLTGADSQHRALEEERLRVRLLHLSESAAM
mmetsp:Transcript_24386/g.49488  ORF Transcript_24386/g.49488 Transcript_24386/m.49488 type:complete len:228 (-) Transcript_24386:196-879(-)